MSEWLIRWQYAPRHWQWLTVLGVPLLLLIFSAWWWLQPLRSHRQLLAKQYQQQYQHYQARLAQLIAQPTLLMQQQQNQQLLASLQAADSATFSLAALMADGAALEKWQPDAQGGELTLLLSWSHFQQTLAYLASRQPPVVINTLLLQRHGEQLRATISLGISNAQ
ncbi:hypothetical protein N5923_08300 [Erwiniaceae bacterium BAC15a-03b]|uniref:DNA utilization protein HofO C-terminal domain-containing protein n=1 Tax=Winslowiella arboricola TaxID=2978220 RepID=A0A9J6PGQ5_9GAMM|nr:hypothetical protein [Winslowiella arboricola]MCU5771859.1 hypothetical protein [Winslowiella arboricola]MCU5777489.1 hypothetical protein [Winslowiella arboricola]